ncbi:hsp70 nucleotide exchange factor FES1 [Amborella trichopoda]|nr:hsp70 nucleotide exchange factor FES1 [Amborella trichopoda]|eukprot:XP_006844772.2 hsp70 nucleotide exchange factor FES1 [Amborella trichopoda]
MELLIMDFCSSSKKAASSLALIVFLSYLLSSSSKLMCSASSEKNRSSIGGGGLFWSTEKEEGDFRKAEMDNSQKIEETTEEQISGGFSSLEGMLQWAIGHSDPAKLRETANDAQRLNELRKRQTEIKELMDKLKMPSDAELMKAAIADLNNSSSSLEDRLHALNTLLVLVEPIDNANDLDKLGGIVAVISELYNSEPEIRTTSAWVLGKASQNNPLVQKLVLDHGGLLKLMKMVKSSNLEEATKALYAVSALISNNFNGQELFYAQAGDLLLMDIMSNSSSDIRLLRKSVFLVADLAESQLQSKDELVLPFLGNRLFLKSVVDLTTSTDLDLEEKTLMAIRSLLQLSTTEALVFKDFCNLGEALEKMRQQFEKLLADEDLREYVRDIEVLRREVEFIFSQKLEKVVSRVPT